AVARRPRRPVGIVLRGEEAGDALRAVDALLHGRRALDFFRVGLFEPAAVLEQVVERADHADAHDVVVLRDIPEPAALVRRLKDHRRAFVPAAVAIRPRPIGPDRALVEDRVPDAQAQAVGDQAVLPAGVDD